MIVDRPRILMAVFNELDFDGRVQRAAEALAATAHVKVFALDGGRGFSPSGYELEVLPVKPGEFSTNRWLHARFLRRLVSLTREYRPAIVYGHDFFLSFSAWLAARLTGAKLVYDAHELIIPGSLGRSRGHLQARVWYFLERLVVRRADLVVAANSSRAEIMAKHYRLTRVPLAIPNVTPDPGQSAAAADVRQRFPKLMRRSDRECLCVYQGDVDLDRGLGAVVDAFSLLSPDFRLLVVGGGPDVGFVRARAAAMAPTAGTVELIGKVPRAELPNILRLCDLGIVCYSFVGLNNIYCAPNKVFEYAHCGIPIVATAQPPLLELVAKSGIGCIAGDSGAPSPSQMADAIRLAWARRDEFKQAIRPFLLQNSWEREAAKLQDAVRSTIGGTHFTRVD